MSPRIDWRLALTLVGLLAAWSMRGCTSYATVEHRFSVIETEQSETARRLERIEGKVDRLLEHLR